MTSKRPPLPSMRDRARWVQQLPPCYPETHTSHAPHLSGSDAPAVPAVSGDSSVGLTASTTHRLRLPGAPLACHPASQAHQLQLVVCRREARHAPPASIALMSQDCCAVAMVNPAHMGHRRSESARSACCAGAESVVAVYWPYLVPTVPGLLRTHGPGSVCLQPPCHGGACLHFILSS